MKITIPRHNQGKQKGGYYRKGKANQEWLHGRKGPSGQKAQSKIREWKDFSEEDRAAAKKAYDEARAVARKAYDRPLEEEKKLARRSRGNDGR